MSWLRYLCLVYPMLPGSLDCPFLIVPSVFSNVYMTLSYCISLFLITNGPRYRYDYLHKK